jgi:hypothetical protein
VTSAHASRKTEQEVQSELMAFADRYFASTLEGAKILEGVSQSPETRYTAAAGRVVALVTTTDIAASPNPGAALLDMTVFVTLRRMVWQDYYMPEVYGEAGRPILDILRELEADIWGIAAGVYTPEQLTQLRGLIDDWRSKHADARAVDFMRLTELGDARQVQTLIDASRPGGMLAPVREANRELEEMRLLAERLAFLATRMQFAVVSDRFAEAFATLVADLPEERRAAVGQILRGLRAEREQIFAELTAEDGGLRPTLGDFQETFDSARLLAEMVNEAVVNVVSGRAHHD